MHPNEWWLFYESKIPADAKLTADEKWQELYEMLG
jgi:hypothetical protein